jgi:amino acid permease
MNQGIAILASIFVSGLIFFICSYVKHGTCDMGNLFSLVVVVISFVTGIYLCVHAIELVKVSPPDSDAAWVGVAGFILTAFSVQQAINTFRELYGRRVTPLQASNNSTAVAPAPPQNSSLPAAPAVDQKPKG